MLKVIEEIVGFKIKTVKQFKSGLAGRAYRVAGEQNQESAVVKLFATDDSGEVPWEVEVYERYLPNENFFPTPQLLGYLKHPHKNYIVLAIEDKGDFCSDDSVALRCNLARQFALWHEENETKQTNTNFFEEISSSQLEKHTTSYFDRLVQEQLLTDSLRPEFESFLQSLPALVRMYKTVEHGDPYYNNIKVDDNGEVVCICDWENVRRGTGLSDLVRIADIAYSINNEVITEYLKVRPFENFNLVFESVKIERYLRVTDGLLNEIPAIEDQVSLERATDTLDYLSSSLKELIMGFKNV
jgi:hypothetical protein